MEVLIADGGLTIRKLLEAYLTEWGYDVVSVSDGNQAWKELKNPDAPRLVILDWLMPGMDGVEVCRNVRQLKHGNLLYLRRPLRRHAGRLQRSQLLFRRGPHTAGCLKNRRLELGE